MNLFSTHGRACSPCGRSEQGFTLIEALVALAILGMLAVGSIEAFGAGVRAQYVADRHVEAVALADARLTELAALPTDSLRRRPAIIEGRFAAPLDAYSWRTTLRRLPGSRTLWAATAEVSWADGQESLETVFFRPVESIDDAAELAY